MNSYYHSDVTTQLHLELRSQAFESLPENVQHFIPTHPSLYLVSANIADKMYMKLEYKI